jgi:hypothetical protein
MEKIKEFLSSRYMSLTCAGVNGFFALSALGSGSWVWFLICGALSGYCLNNYLKD